MLGDLPPVQPAWCRRKGRPGCRLCGFELRTRCLLSSYEFQILRHVECLECYLLSGCRFQDSMNFSRKFLQCILSEHTALRLCLIEDLDVV